MCVSDHMGLLNRVGRSGFSFLQYFFIVPRVRFLFKNKKIFALILDKFRLQNLITSLKVVQFTSFLYDPE